MFIVWTVKFFLLGNRTLFPLVIVNAIYCIIFS